MPIPEHAADSDERWPSTVLLRELTLAEFRAEAEARFGRDPLSWAFMCPACNDIATVAQFSDALLPITWAGQECIGRFVTGRGCEYTAYGVVKGPWRIGMPDGTHVYGFPLATPEEGNRRGIFCAYPDALYHDPATCPTTHQ